MATMVQSSDASVSQRSETGGPIVLSSSAWEEEFISALQTELSCVNTVLAGRTESVSCCWFDTSKRGVSQEGFERLFAKYPEGTYRTRVLCCVNTCILYGVWVDGEKTPAGDVATLDDEFPEWVEFIYPWDYEKKGAFFERLEREFFTVQLEAVSGFSMTL